MASPSGDRLVAFGLRLAQAHQELRRRISEIRTHPGHARWPDDTLLTHCLAFCAALASHHGGEDGGMFAELLRVHPDLGPAVVKLVEDHELIAAILSRVRDVAARPAESATDRDAIRGELDGLAAIMESHFRYEERTIGGLLDDGVVDTGWSPAVLGLGG